MEAGRVRLARPCYFLFFAFNAACNFSANDPIGASAAVCGLIGATLYFGRSRGGVYGHAVYRQIGGWAIGIFMFGFLVPAINNWAHGGGMLAGAALGFLLGYRERRREKQSHKIVALCCIAVTALILLWAILSSLYILLLS